MSICATYLEEGLVLLACKSDPTAHPGGSLFWPFHQGICSLAYKSDHAFHLLGLSRVLCLWSLSNDCAFLLCTLKSFYMLACPAVGTRPMDTKLCGASESMWCAGGTASEASPATDTLPGSPLWPAPCDTEWLRVAEGPIASRSRGIHSKHQQQFWRSEDTGTRPSRMRDEARDSNLRWVVKWWSVFPGKKPVYGDCVAQITWQDPPEVLNRQGIVFLVEWVEIKM